MNSHELRAKLSRLRHPSEEELFLSLDGELGARKARAVRAHLQACWSCRVQVEELSRGLAKAVQLRDDLVEAVPPRWDPPRFERRVAQLLQQTPERSGRRPLLFLRRLPVQAAMAALVVGTLLWLHLGAPEPVSAHQLYQRAEAAESLRLNPVEQPVVYQKIQVRRLAARVQETGTVETWTATRRARREQRGGDSVWREVAAVLESNRLSLDRPLSASSYRQWAEGLPTKEQVVETRGLSDGSSAWVIRTTVPAAGPRPFVEQAELVLRQTDLHPVQENLRVLGDSGDREYQLTELAFDVLPAAGLDPAIFQDPPRRAMPNVKTRPAAVAPPATPRPSTLAVPPESIPELTVQAFYILHQLGRCAGEPFEVERSGDQVVVRGLVDTDARKEWLLAAFRKFPGLRLEIRTYTEARAETVAQDASPAAVAEARRGQDYLRALADKDVAVARLTEISNSAVTHSNAWLLDAWALRRLAGAFPAEILRDLAPIPAGLLEKMVRDHAESMRSHAVAFQSEVRPVFGGPAAEPSAGKPPCWPATAAELFDAASRAQRLAQVLFTGEGLLTEPAESALQHLLSFTSAMEARSRELETRAAEIFRSTTFTSQSEVRREP